MDLAAFKEETRQLMAEHVVGCPDCDAEGVDRCVEYFRLLLRRVKEEEQRATN